MVMEVSRLVVIAMQQERDDSKASIAQLPPAALNILSLYKGKMKPWGPVKGVIELQLWEHILLD